MDWLGAPIFQSDIPKWAFPKNSGAPNNESTQDVSSMGKPIIHHHPGMFWKRPTLSSPCQLCMDDEGGPLCPGVASWADTCSKGQGHRASDPKEPGMTRAVHGHLHGLHESLGSTSPTESTPKYLPWTVPLDASRPDTSNDCAGVSESTGDLGQGAKMCGRDACSVYVST